MEFYNIKNVNKQKLKKAFEIYTKKLIKNFKYIEKYDNIRIISYNIHSFTDLYGKCNTYELLLTLIKNFDIDILCLQEVDFQEIDKKIVFQNFTEMGYKFKYYKAGTKYNNFGNMICVKKNIINNIKFYKIDLGKNCIYGCVKNCNHKKNENRNAIVCILNNNLRLINLHLDVWDETGEIRKKQLEILIKNLKNNNIQTFIMGDFNSYNEKIIKNKKLIKWIKKDDKNRSKDFEYSLDILTDNNYKDIFNKIDITVWSGRRTDYVFKNDNYKKDYKIKNKFIIPLTLSDHYPLVFDI